MAKSTQKQALLTEKRIHQAIVDIFMEKGWEAISYGSIAKHTGLSRGGVQRIVPNKDAMMSAFQGQVAQFVAGQLDFSTEKSITESWLIALENLQFRNCLKFFIGAISSDTLGKTLAKKGFDGFSDKVGQEKMQSLIGLSVYRLLED
ncbi:TetR/AcrR family transcriptional regulator [Psychromonas sp. Urea-02u-13]|uniref:TetR/AcrR family transcriptional regulator n=1 Tax=Psychromonas sp. Urea-02u-13 TaxID=2058326 RepID=UPI000C32B355|nr:TetR/AcrR family transcriptional regulator [Psychromonas sp. Urea-02u-13]PKG38382.1 TetR/AcrR family transcriptional regulator [Psychromonas sp. Urea-02u-13]